MFLVRDKADARAAKIEAFLDTDPAIALLLAAVHVEWIFRRVILTLSKTPTRELRIRLAGDHGLESYKNRWKAEVFPESKKSLVQVVRGWKKLTDAFKVRGALVHGAQSTSKKHAIPHVRALLSSATELTAFAKSYGVDIYVRLRKRPVRRETS